MTNLEQKLKEMLAYALERDADQYGVWHTLAAEITAAAAADAKVVKPIRHALELARVDLVQQNGLYASEKSPVLLDTAMRDWHVIDNEKAIGAIDDALNAEGALIAELEQAAIELDTASEVLSVNFPGFATIARNAAARKRTTINKARTI